MTQGPVVDQHLLHSFNRLIARTRVSGGNSMPDSHGVIQEFAGLGDVELPISVIMVVTKPCQLVEWTLDSMTLGSCVIGLEWSPWVMPRVWQDIIGVGAAPKLVSQENNGDFDLNKWSGPVYFGRKEALRITVLEATGIESLTLALYMKELPVSAKLPETAP